MSANSLTEAFAYHHVGIAVKDMQQAIESYKTLFGYQLTSGPFDDPIQDVSVCFLSRGGTDPALELVAALGPNSPVHRLVKKGGGTYHLCYTVPDIDAAIAHLTAHNCLLLTQPVPAVAFEGRKIAWLISDTGLFELIQA